MTAGIYSLVGFEVTPATVIGLLAILGFSLYDTVVVYDKVQENTKGLTSLLRRTYRGGGEPGHQPDADAVDQHQPDRAAAGRGAAGGGVAILGSGTLRDLALVQLVGMIVSGYSSVFLAVPIAVDLRVRDPAIKAHTARVLAKRKADGLIVDADGDPIGRVPRYGAPRPRPRSCRARFRWDGDRGRSPRTICGQPASPAHRVRAPAHSPAPSRGQGRGPPARVAGPPASARAESSPAAWPAPALTRPGGGGRRTIGQHDGGDPDRPDRPRRPRDRAAPLCRPDRAAPPVASGSGFPRAGRVVPRHHAGAGRSRRATVDGHALAGLAGRSTWSPGSTLAAS